MGIGLAVLLVALQHDLVDEVEEEPLTVFAGGVELLLDHEHDQPRALWVGSAIFGDP